MTTFEFIDANLRECLINLANARVKPNVTETEIESLKEKIEHWDTIKREHALLRCKDGF